MNFECVFFYIWTKAIGYMAPENAEVCGYKHNGVVALQNVLLNEQFRFFPHNRSFWFEYDFLFNLLAFLCFGEKPHTSPSHLARDLPDIISVTTVLRKYTG